ncbi:DUF4251 domain-containing protein [Psychroserpens sp. Hel_I_66]|uniref:DUF4251 domain-containing protein n=1 Tax=Psychroserpens sp. Hel_I_66 TaxID=1250004 RepID=UPI0006473A40|nr:DUF4251 domain-containing protein [Psychroserpens sp. Hel_I_66]
MKTQYIILLFIISIFTSCSSTKVSATPSQIAALDQLVENKSFVIESDWALPQTTNSLMALQNAGFFAAGDNASRINLIGNPNELKIIGDSITSKLPYYGEVQSTTGYSGSNSGINFEGELKDYRIEKNDDNSYSITFDARSNSENFDVIINLYPNLNSEMILKGTKRFPIRYTGHVSSISE